jgi:hypothetical protein
MHDNKPNNFYIKHFFIIFQIKKLQRLFDTFVPLGIIISVDTRVFNVHRTSQKTLKPWEVFLYPINIFVIVSRCKYNLVEKIFATHIINM